MPLNDRDIAAVTRYSAYWIGQTAARHNAERPAGMTNRQRPATCFHWWPTQIHPRPGAMRRLQNVLDDTIIKKQDGAKGAEHSRIG